MPPAHANPDTSLCLLGLKDSWEMAAHVAARLEHHLCWKAWQCRPGTCSVSQNREWLHFPQIIAMKNKNCLIWLFFSLFSPQLRKEICLDHWIIKGKTHYMANILSEHFRRETHTKDLSHAGFIKTRYLLWKRRNYRLGKNTVKPGCFLI